MNVLTEKHLHRIGAEGGQNGAGERERERERESGDKIGGGSLAWINGRVVLGESGRVG